MKSLRKLRFLNCLLRSSIVPLSRRLISTSKCLHTFHTAVYFIHRNKREMYCNACRLVMTKRHRRPLTAAYPLKQRTNWIVPKLLHNSRDACSVARKRISHLVCMLSRGTLVSVCGIVMIGIPCTDVFGLWAVDGVHKRWGTASQTAAKAHAQDNVSVDVSCALKCLT